MFKGNESSLQFHLKTTPASYKFALPLQISFMVHLAKIFYIEGKLSNEFDISVTKILSHD